MPYCAQHNSYGDCEHFKREAPTPTTPVEENDGTHFVVEEPIEESE